MSTRVIENLRYLIEATWQSGQTVARAEKDIRGLGDTVEDTKTRGSRDWATMGKQVAGFGVAMAAGLGAATVAGKKFYEALGSGAGLEAAQLKFDNLAESIDSTGDAMLGRLKDATQGLMSDAQLVASATQIMSLGLQDTEEGVVRLSTVAGNLGWDMNQVILTMANDSVMRLDALGLSIDAVKEKQKALEDAGMEAGKAFDLAVIEAGEEKYKLLGDQVNTTAGKMKIFETAVENAQDEFDLQLVTSFAEGLGDTATEAATAADDIATLTGAVGTFLGTLAGGTLGTLGRQLSAKEITDSAVALGLMSDEYSKILVQNLKRGAPGAIEDLGRYRTLLADYRTEADRMTDSWQRAQDATGDYAGELEESGSVFARSSGEVQLLKDRLFEGGAEFQNMKTQAELTRGVLEEGIGMLSLADDTGEAIGATQALLEQLRELDGMEVNATIRVSQETTDAAWGAEMGSLPLPADWRDYPKESGYTDKYFEELFGQPSPPSYVPYSPPPPSPGPGGGYPEGAGNVATNNTFNINNSDVDAVTNSIIEAIESGAIP